MSSKSKSARSGLTLIEIMVALTMTLVVLGAMMLAFRYATTEIAGNRSIMELSNQLRNAQNLLRSDTNGVTVDVRPWSKTASPNGYFELIEGSGSDNSFGVGAEGVRGDVDDILAMTVRSDERPFRGRLNGNIVESDIAEVVWWTSFQDLNGNNQLEYDETVTLHRRVLLIRPDLNLAPGAASPQEIQEFFLVNDISARVDASGSLATNSLADLARRENRFARLSPALRGSPPGTLPSSAFDLQLGNAGGASSVGDLGLRAFEMSAENLASVTGGDPQLPARAGDDVVLTDVLGFDLQVYSPGTLIREQDGVATEPDDLVYGGTAVAQGAYVDLGYTGFAAGTGPQFSSLPNPLSVGYVSYDTYSTHYESGGVGTDGIDNDGNGVVDDNFERVAFPPYPQRLRGMKATLRVVERKSKQVRQVEVISSFVPE